MPMISPCIMKIVVTLFALAPIVFRMAMSRCFSITSRTSDATMFSAATMTMRPIVSETAIFSSESAVEQRLVHHRPVLGGVVAAEAVDYGPRHFRRPREVVDAQLDEIDLRPCRTGAWRRRSTRTRTSNRTRTGRARRCPPTRSRRAGRSVSPFGVNISCGVSTDTVSPTPTPSFVARSFPMRMPSRLARRHPLLPVRPRRQRSMLPLCIALLTSVTCCSSTGSIPFT